MDTEDSMKTVKCGFKHLRKTLLPLLDGHVFHVTSNNGYAGIIKQGKIKHNQNSAFPHTHSQLKQCYGNAIGGVCLFDFRNFTDWNWGQGRPETFLNPPVFNNESIYLILSEEIYPKLILWKAAYEGKHRYKTHVPHVECWYQGEISSDHIIDTFKLIVKPRESNSYWPNS